MGFFGSFFSPAFEPSIWVMLGISIAVAIWLASGFLAATISEMKGRNCVFHFIGGLIFPYIYLGIVLLLPSTMKALEPEGTPQFDEEGNYIPTEGQSLTRKYMEKVGEKYVAAPLLPKEEEEKSLVEEEAKVSVFTQQYFSSIATDAQGNHLGPYMICLDDGRILEALRILDAHAEVFELEISGEGDKPRKVRLPYAKIAICELKEEWLKRQ